MPVVLGTGFVLATADEVPGTPWIGWHNVVSANPQNVTATTNAADSINLANPSTNLKWVGTTATEQYITVTTDPATTGEGDVDYLGVAKHNFGSAGIAVSVEGVVTNPATDTQTKLLLHFDGTDGSTTFTDSSANPKTFAAVGDAQIDTSQSVFGGASGRFDGTGDRITTPDHADFVLGTIWTIHFRLRTDGATAINRGIAQQRVDANNGLRIRIDGLPEVELDVRSGGVDIINIDTNITHTNDAWHHIAFVSDGADLYAFVDGVLGQHQVGAAVNVPDFAAAFEIGREEGSANPEFDGWLDEFTVIVGAALWTDDFDPPEIAGPWTQLTSPAVPADDSPLMFRWDPATYYQVRLRMQAGSAAPQAAVVYIGELLVCERSIDVNVEHVPVTYGRRTHAVNGMSQSGEFLGRIVIGEHRETKAEFKWFQDTWWRTNFDPFLEAAQEIPFFWAWSPDEYPAECGYVWLTNDAEASVDPVTRRVHTELVMEGVA